MRDRRRRGDRRRQAGREHAAGRRWSGRRPGRHQVAVQHDGLRARDRGRGPSTPGDRDRRQHRAAARSTCGSRTRRQRRGPPGSGARGAAQKASRSTAAPGSGSRSASRSPPAPPSPSSSRHADRARQRPPTRRWARRGRSDAARHWPLRLLGARSLLGAGACGGTDRQTAPTGQSIVVIHVNFDASAIPAVNQIRSRLTSATPGSTIR